MLRFRVKVQLFRCSLVKLFKCSIALRSIVQLFRVQSSVRSPLNHLKPFIERKAIEPFIEREAFNHFELLFFYSSLILNFFTLNAMKNKVIPAIISVSFQIY